MGNLNLKKALLRARKTAWIVGSTLLVALFFQNCSFKTSAPDLSEIQNSLKSSAGSTAGNGDGYGGKVTGVYAQVDTSGQCSITTHQEKAIVSKIKFENDKVFIEVENCQPLLVPREISLEAPEAVSSDGTVLAFKTGIYQKGDWTQQTRVRRDQYVDVICQGVNPVQVSDQSQRRVEVSIFNHREEYPIGILPGMQKYLRVGVLKYEDFSISTGLETASGVLTYDRIVETVVSPPSSLERSHYYQSEAASSAHNFSLSYLSSVQSGLLQGHEMTYAAYEQGIFSVRPLDCWSNPK